MDHAVMDDADDPYLWLEEVEGERAVAWVEAQNRRTIAQLCDADFPSDKQVLQALMESQDRIPAIIQRGTFLYNVWTDAAHPRGVWRRTTMAAFRTPAPDWDVILDIDALGAAEGESWVWHGATTFPPAHDRALISLSPGGSDAAVIREFDLPTRRFVEGGFAVPVSKSSAAWADVDTLLVGAAFDGDVTTSGYPRTVRRWSRGTPLQAAPVIFEVEPSDMAASVMVSHDPAHPYTLFTRTIAFWRNVYLYEAPDGVRHVLDVPEHAGIEISHGRLLVALREDWAVGGAVFPGGSLVAIALAAFLAGARDFAVVFTPGPRAALEGFVSVKSGIVLAILENVASRLAFAAADDGWRMREIAGLPPASSISAGRLAPADPASETLLFHAEGFLQPSRMLAGSPAGVEDTLKALPPQFDVTGLGVEQLEAIAADGTKIPYFLVGPHAGTAPQAPVYLYGYGGFEISLTPFYAAQMGALWCAKGGRFAVANIRGGGEFGPEWHQAGIRAGKKTAQDDFAAVAADLTRRGIAPAGRILGAGGSNGGLLTGNMLTRHPHSFGALICTVPLLDMRRYTRLLAGASWIAEYGDPLLPEDWAFLRQISAYHLVAPGQPYPPIFIATTRRDDRVHPGHARKMAAKLQALGYQALYFEQDEGGHGAGADAGQKAFFVALEYAFARQTVGRANI